MSVPVGRASLREGWGSLHGYIRRQLKGFPGSHSPRFIRARTPVIHHCAYCGMLNWGVIAITVCPCTIRPVIGPITHSRYSSQLPCNGEARFGHSRCGPRFISLGLLLLFELHWIVRLTITLPHAVAPWRRGTRFRIHDAAMFGLAVRRGRRS